MVDSIINIELDDNVVFRINGINAIRDEDEYGGYRVHMSFEFENIKEKLKLDIATGDSITPSEINLKYKTMLDHQMVKIPSYNIETLLAEKLETILSKLEVNSRMKDYYDIFLIFNRSFDDINKDIFIRACKNTFKNRNFNMDLLETFDIIKSSLIIRKRWEDYSRKYIYAKNITYDEVLDCIAQIIDIILPVIV